MPACEVAGVEHGNEAASHVVGLTTQLRILQDHSAMLSVSNHVHSRVTVLAIWTWPG